MRVSDKAVGPGRPRDPEIEERAHAEALRLYQSRGREGVSFGSVAAASSIGKAALYRRWSSADELLLDALQARIGHYNYGRFDEAQASLRDDLLLFARKSLDNYLANHTLILRVWAEAEAHPDLLASHHERVVSGAAAAARTIVERARDRGELSADVPSSMVLAPIFGGLLGLVIMAKPGLDGGAEASLYAQAEMLVDVTLHGVVGLDQRPAQ